MFDIGFSELLVVFVVALIILGPERLPTAAKTAGLWVRKIRRSISSVQREINAQLDQEELSRKIEQTNQRILQESKDIQNTILPSETNPLDTTDNQVEPTPAQSDTTTLDQDNTDALAQKSSDTPSTVDAPRSNKYDGLKESTQSSKPSEQDDLLSQKIPESQSSRP